MKELKPAIYKDLVNNNTWDAYSSHDQVDTGLGFTCDIEVKEVVLSLNSKGWKTLGSCQATDLWLVKRRSVSFYHEDTHKLLDFCLYLKNLMPRSGFQQRLVLDNYHEGGLSFAIVDYTPDLDTLFITSVQEYER